MTLKRLLQAVFVVLGILTIVFFVSRVIGDPVALMLPPEADADSRARMYASLGLDQPMPVQFAEYVGQVVQGDFGDSLRHHVPAIPLVLSRVPATLLLAAATLAMAVPVGLLLGAGGAYKPGSLLDRLINVVSLAGVSLVEFWFALMLVLVFAVQLGWLPTSGFGSPEAVVLPAAALALRPMGRLAQFTRSALLDEYAKPYVKTLRSLGMTEPRVFLRVLRNAGVPIITVTGDDVVDLASGTVVIETVFAWPGIGFLLVQAIGQRDFVLVQATAVVIAVTVVVVNLMVDLTYSYLDPRIRY